MANCAPNCKCHMTPTASCHSYPTHMLTPTLDFKGGAGPFPGSDLSHCGSNQGSTTSLSLFLTHVSTLRAKYLDPGNQKLPSREARELTGQTGLQWISPQLESGGFLPRQRSLCQERGPREVLRGTWDFKEENSRKRP